MGDSIVMEKGFVVSVVCEMWEEMLLFKAAEHLEGPKIKGDKQPETTY